MSQDKVITKNDIRRLRSIFGRTNYNLRILAKIYSGYRPSQIAQQLGISVQNINYYTSNLIDLELIEKIGNGKGIAWRVTEK